MQLQQADLLPVDQAIYMAIGHALLLISEDAIIIIIEPYEE